MKEQDRNRKELYIHETSIPGLVLVERSVYHDNRGFFHEVFRLDELKAFTGIDFNPVQWNHSVSKPGVIRAIHTEEWNKLIYPLTGKMFAAFVDTRLDSPSFGKVYTHVFDNTEEDSPHTAVFISAGIGNSICVIGDEDVNYMYLVDEYWNNSKAKGIAWDDPDLAIDWPVKDPIISERDRNNPSMRDLFPDRYK